MNTLPQRRSIRLRHYDYSQAGFYFVTICTHEKQALFGEIIGREMCLNRAGIIAQSEWHKTGLMREKIILHDFVVMPNHVHGIIEIVNSNDTTSANYPNVGAHCVRPHSDNIHDDDNSVYYPNSVIGGRTQCAPTLGFVIRGYKAAVTKQIHLLQSVTGQKIWQRNYHEHVIRNEASYLKIAEYVQTNPLKWHDDRYHF